MQQSKGNHQNLQNYQTVHDVVISKETNLADRLSVACFNYETREVDQHHKSWSALHDLSSSTLDIALAFEFITSVSVFLWKKRNKIRV